MKFLTFLNSGCIEICKNMLISAENVGIDMNDFYIACLDRNAFNIMRSYKNAYLYESELNCEISEYQNWSFDADSKFRLIVRNKWPIIKSIYKNHKDLCWVDSDIVFLKNPLEIIEKKNQILFQCDDPGLTLCSGFMVFNSTIECQKFVEECSQYVYEDDQRIVNYVGENYIPHLAILDLDMFPNGHRYYQENRKENAYIVHNNFMVGIEEKIKRFKEEKLWYL